MTTAVCFNILQPSSSYHSSWDWQDDESKSHEGTEIRVSFFCLILLHCFVDCFKLNLTKKNIKKYQKNPQQLKKISQGKFFLCN